MSNMSYCRFQNTLEDLRDCYENMDESFLSEGEEIARMLLIRECKKLADDYADEIEYLKARE